MVKTKYKANKLLLSDVVQNYATLKLSDNDIIETDIDILNASKRSFQ